jgi:pimeloyl-ACP methyl ester carboxylesterase
VHSQPAATASGVHTTTVGDRGPWVAFCHGLFGQGRNWTQVAKALTERRRALLVDLPDHGRSGWTERFDLVAHADLVAAAIAERTEPPVALVGHSLGGKVAMVVALRHPALVERLCVVDVAPVTYPHSDEFAGYIDAMLAVDLDRLERRDQADAALAEAVPNPVVRSFLLQNLRREGAGWRWQPNLRLLRTELDAITAWPDLPEVSPYDGPVLWVGGERSPYIRDEYADAMARLFPKVLRVTVKGAGHWVHAEQQDAFVAVLRQFLPRVRS